MSKKKMVLGEAFGTLWESKVSLDLQGPGLLGNHQHHGQGEKIKIGKKTGAKRGRRRCFVWAVTDRMESLAQNRGGGRKEGIRIQFCEGKMTLEGSLR